MSIRAETEVDLTRVDDGQSGEDAVLLRIDSTRGTVFKNNDVNTVLSVAIYKGENRITTNAGLIAEFGALAYLQWYAKRMNEEEFHIISRSDERLSDGGFSFTLSPEDVDTKCVFMCNLII